MSKNFHIPGPATSPEPAELVKIASSIQHPHVTRTGLTTTEEGSWALLVVVQPGTVLPINEVEEKCTAFPVIYREDTGKIPVARPAYPAWGE